MEIYKRILKNSIVGLLIVSVTLIFVTGCNRMKKQEKFPVDSKGYPLVNAVMVNGEVKRELNPDSEKNSVKYAVPKGDEIEIVLAQGLPIHEWTINPNLKGVELIGSEKELPKENGEYELEGLSPMLEKFKFKITDKNALSEIQLKKVNTDLIFNDDGSKREDFSYSNAEDVMELTIKFE